MASRLLTIYLDDSCLIKLKRGEKCMKHCLLALLFLLVCMGGTAFARFTPEFTFTDLDGKVHSSENLQYTPLVLYVGSTF